ncbi:MAG: InlB B-repeat-containing protein, partial [Clostridia bacterium]|nr:InlB B-repeat-containing protein [Clostridia bacterium]
VTSNLTVTAQYLINTYTVTFVDWDGTVLKTQTVDYGAAATAPADPARVGYTFTGWDVDFSNVTSNLTVTAQYVQDTVNLLGDVNCDGSVDFSDVTMLASYVVHAVSELSEQSMINADMNQDGEVNSLDISYIYNFLMNNR